MTLYSYCDVNNVFYYPYSSDTSISMFADHTVMYNSKSDAYRADAQFHKSYLTQPRWKKMSATHVLVHIFTSNLQWILLFKHVCKKVDVWQNMKMRNNEKGNINI